VQQNHLKDDIFTYCHTTKEYTLVKLSSLIYHVLWKFYEIVKVCCFPQTAPLTKRIVTYMQDTYTQNYAYMLNEHNYILIVHKVPTIPVVRSKTITFCTHYCTHSNKLKVSVWY